MTNWYRCHKRRTCQGNEGGGGSVVFLRLHLRPKLYASARIAVHWFGTAYVDGYDLDGWRCVPALPTWNRSCKMKQNQEHKEVKKQRRRRPPANLIRKFGPRYGYGTSMLLNGLCRSPSLRCLWRVGVDFEIVLKPWLVKRNT